MSFVDDDLGSFFAGLDEVPVIFGGVTRQGHLDNPADIFQEGKMGGMESQQKCVSIPGAAFSPMPLPKQIINVAGANYSIVSRKLSEDGRVWTLELAL